MTLQLFFMLSFADAVQTRVITTHHSLLCMASLNLNVCKLACNGHGHESIELIPSPGVYTARMHSYRAHRCC